MNEPREFQFRQTPPARPIRFDGDACIGCNRCLEACMIDVFRSEERRVGKEC